MSEDVTWRPIRWGGAVKAHLIVAGDILSLCGVAQMEHAVDDPSTTAPAGVIRCQDCERIATRAAELVDHALAGADPDDGPRCRVCGCTDDRACVIHGVPCRWVEGDLCSACVGHDTGDLVAALRGAVEAARARREAKAAAR